MESTVRSVDPGLSVADRQTTGCEQALRARRNELVGRMAAVVLHEMRDPLSVVRGYAELIARDTAMAEGDHRLRGLLRGVERLRTVVDCVTSMIHGPARDGRTADVATSIALARDFVVMAHRPRPEVEIALPGGVPPVQVAAVDLEQVILNLLINACEATDPLPMARVSATFGPDGPAPPRWGPWVVSTTAETEWGTVWPRGRAAVTITIQDRGAGVRPDVVPSLFRERVSTRGRGADRGAGLLLCRDLLAPYGATAVVESSSGKGTVASMIVPAIAGSALLRPGTERAVAQLP